jgi:ABC-type Zn uptake system ZnuABC Zn-binding protein ZnuA
MKDYLSEALLKLRPNSQFNYSNRDYSTIEWIVLEGKEPTQVEVDTAIEQIKADETQAIIDQTNAKTTAQAKLAALGLTVEDLQALGL